MKHVIILVIVTCLIACKKDDPDNSNTAAVVGLWKVQQYIRNGVPDPLVTTRQEKYDFRADGKLYFSQSATSFKDTFNYMSVDANNIKISNPAISSTYFINLKIDAISSTAFDFTLTNSEDADVEKYKTLK